MNPFLKQKFDCVISTIIQGIHTFIDDRELQRGDEIKPSLDNAIKKS